MMKQAVEEYFRSWINKDPSAIETYFADDCVYVECYGPVYENKAQCLRWFSDWNQKGAVLEWTIKRYLEIGDMCVAEWFFHCEYEGNADGFDGVSIIDFQDGKICGVREFQSNAAHVYPYKGVG